MSFLNQDLSIVWPKIKESAVKFCRQISEGESKTRQVEALGLALVVTLFLVLAFGTHYFNNSRAQYAAVFLAQETLPLVDPVAPVAPTPLPSSVATVTPRPASVISGSQTFSWNGVRNANEYSVSLGTTRGGKQIFDQSVASSTSVTIDNIPDTSFGFYLRIGYKVNTYWRYRDVTYKAEHAPVTKIIIVAPSATTTLSSSQTFTWKEVYQASEYFVKLGTTSGGTQLFNQSVASSTSVTIDNIPQTGKPVYLRVSYKVGTRWGYRTVSYKTGTTTTPTAPPSITNISPSSGAIGAALTITGSNFTATGNQTHFSCSSGGGAGALNIPSTDGHTLVTTVPPVPTPVGTIVDYPLACTVTVSNAGGGSNSVPFSLTTATIQPSISVRSPNGGETWVKGTTQNITWTAPVNFVATYVDIKLAPYYPPCTGTICPAIAYRDPYPIASNISIDNHVYSWNVGMLANPTLNGTAPEGAYTIQICQSGTGTPCDSSDRYFTITPAATSAAISAAVTVLDGSIVCITAPCEFPLTNATVSLFRANPYQLVVTQNTHSGAALFLDLPSGSYTAKASASGFQDATQTFSVTGGDTVQVKITLQKAVAVTSPYINSVSPSSTPNDGKTPVLIAGWGFDTSSLVILRGSGAEFLIPNVFLPTTNPGELAKLGFYIPTNIPVGPYSLLVRNNKAAGIVESNEVSFYVFSPNPTLTPWAPTGTVLGEQTSAGGLTQPQVDAILSLLRSFGAEQRIVDNVHSALTGAEPQKSERPCVTFARNLRIGDQGDDVTKLTGVLSQEGLLDGKTDTFNEEVGSAVVGFQEKYDSEILTPNNLKRGNGFVGNATRAKLNKLGCPGQSGGEHLMMPMPDKPPRGEPGTQLPPSTTAPITEHVTCVFDGATTEQKCYTHAEKLNATFYCSGIGSCSTEVKGFNAALLTWRSSCPSDKYPITKIDGQDETVNFSCSSTTQTLIPICNLTSDKTSYVLGDTITLSWTSQNATYAAWQQDTSGKDHLILPGDKLVASGSQTITANVIGNPSVTLLVGGYGGRGSCSKTVNIASPGTQP